MPSRRSFLALLAAGAAGLVSAPEVYAAPRRRRERSGIDRDSRWLEITVPRRGRGARQALVLAPAHGPPGQKYPVLLLFHGRGETRTAHAGMHAWRSGYGLAAAYAALRRPPLGPDPERARFLRPEQLHEIQARLADQPFGGLVIVCPVTPNPFVRGAAAMLDGYADWIESALLPRVAAVAPVTQVRRIGVDGCSMGGHVVDELFARKPQLFQTFGLVQPALDRGNLRNLAQRLGAATERSTLSGIHLETSSEDPYRRRTEALAGELRRMGVPHALDVLRGPHTRGWLRAAGTLTMLAWHEHMLRRAASAAPSDAPPPALDGTARRGASPS